jgi:hypothetical protein
MGVCFGSTIPAFGRHVTSQKVAGSSPDEVFFFNYSDPFIGTMALESTEPLTNEYHE